MLMGPSSAKKNTKAQMKNYDNSTITAQKYHTRQRSNICNLPSRGYPRI